MHSSTDIHRFDHPLRRFSRPLLVAFACFQLTASISASASTAVSNLGNFHNGNFGISQEAPFTRGRAQAFTTGNDPLLLESATLAMSAIGAAGSGGFQVGLYSNGGDNLPDTKLLPLSGSDTPTASANYAFTAPIEFTLAPATTYWIVAELPLNGPDAVSYFWTFTVNSAETGLPGWSLGASADSTSFMGWEPTWGPQSVPLRMAIDVQPVPEPTAVSVLGIVLAGFVATRRKRKS